MSTISLENLRVVVSQMPDEELQRAFQILNSEVKQREDGMLRRAVPRFVGEPVDKTDQYDNSKYAGLGAQVDPNYEAKIQQNYEKRNEETKLHVSESGATSSHVPLRYDLIPRSLIEIVAKRYTEGAVKHGERGYQKGLADWEFILNRINHIQEHWNKLFHHSRDDEDESPRDHIGAILWGIGFLCELTEHDKGKDILNKILHLGMVRRI